MDLFYLVLAQLSQLKGNYTELDTVVSNLRTEHKELKTLILSLAEEYKIEDAKNHGMDFFIDNSNKSKIVLLNYIHITNYIGIFWLRLWGGLHVLKDHEKYANIIHGLQNNIQETTLELSTQTTELNQLKENINISHETCIGLKRELSNMQTT